MTRTLIRATAAILLIAYLATSLVTAQQGGTTRYVYDDNGRLRAVVSPASEAAFYDYDPAGNITGITRRPATFLSLVSFGPKSGAIGTQVTINGTGFGATAGANTVRFNGTAATINQTLLQTFPFIAGQTTPIDLPQLPANGQYALRILPA